MDFEQRGYPRLEHRGGDAIWIERLCAKSSAQAVEVALRRMLRGGVDAHELTPLFRALNRCAGGDAATVSDSLIGDDNIPGAPYLWYRKQELAPAPHRQALAVHVEAAVVVTFNIRDFPADACAPLDIEIEHPDTFAARLVADSAVTVLAAVEEMAGRRVRPPSSPGEIIDHLERSLPAAMRELRPQS
ncbi:MAG: hypothetical protein ACRD1K_15150 [Acidimicrobiales bacterium]